MKLRNLPRGQRVSILERKAVAPNGKIRNTYELVIRIGKGKGKAVLLRSQIEKAIGPLLAEGA
jgi:hypothetical protein